MRNGTTDAATLADIFLAAPFEPNGWDLALKRLASATRSGHSQLIAFGGPSTIPLNWVTDPAPGFIEEFPLIDGGSPDVNWRVACSGSALEVKWEHHYDVARRRLKSDIYDEFADRFDLPFGCQTVLLHTPEVFYGLATLRSSADGRSEEVDRDIFTLAAPHVLTAIKLQQSLEHQGAALIADTLDAMRSAVFVFDRLGRVQALTASAEAKLREPIGLRLIRNRLIADHPDDHRAIQQALSAVLDDAQGSSRNIQFWLQGEFGGFSPLRCEMLPLPRRDWTLGFEPRAILSVHLPRGFDEQSKKQLGTLLKLTSAEAAVAINIANGCSREEIAISRGSSGHTINSQLKTIFQKADVNRESELVALVNRLLR